MGAGEDFRCSSKPGACSVPRETPSARRKQERHRSVLSEAGTGNTLPELPFVSTEEIAE
jgi:hypothetical protein